MPLFVVRDSKILQNCMHFMFGLPMSKQWDVEIKEHKATRSKQQNNYYWMCLGVLEKETGQDSEELHEFFKADILGFRDIQYKGSIKSVPKSTTKLNTRQFAEYMNEVIARAAKEGYSLPSPEYFGMENSQ